MCRFHREFLSHSRQQALELRRVAERSKAALPPMLHARTSHVFDGAPVLLGTPGDLARERDQAVDVPAIRAVHFLQRIQIGQPVAVDDDLVTSSYPFEPKQPKTRGLINLHP